MSPRRRRRTVSGSGFAYSPLVTRCHFRFAYFWHTFDAPLYLAWARRVVCTCILVLLPAGSPSLLAAEEAALGAETGAEVILTMSFEELLSVGGDRIVDYPSLAEKRKP